MKATSVYSANFDYYDTYDKILLDPLVIPEQTEKGNIKIFRKNSKKPFVILSPSGKIEIFHETREELECILKKIRKLLVPKDGEELRLSLIKYIPPYDEMKKCYDVIEELKKDGLEKVDDWEETLNRFVKPLLDQLDPGPACEILTEIDSIIDEKINLALKDKDYQKVQALANVAESLKDYRKLCGLTKNRTVTLAETPRKSEDFYFKGLFKTLADHGIGVVVTNQGMAEHVLEDIMISKYAEDVYRKYKYEKNKKMRKNSHGASD